MKIYGYCLSLFLCLCLGHSAHAQSAKLSEVFNADQALFNGHVKRFFSSSAFDSYFGDADSIRLLIDEQPCSYIFENEDGSKDVQDEYLYKDGSRFERSGDKVAVDEFRFSETNFLMYASIRLDARTTRDDLNKIFPNAVEQMGDIDVQGEGKLQLIQLREDAENISDGHVRIFLKQAKLYSIHWWFPC